MTVDSAPLPALSPGRGTTMAGTSHGCARGARRQRVGHDHNAACAACRPTLEGRGRIVHPSCQRHSEERTCLGGMLPNAREGADAAGSPALVDPTPGKARKRCDEVVLVPDGADQKRRRCGARSGTEHERFEPARQVRRPARRPGERGRARPARRSAPTQRYYVTRRDWIVQIRNAASDTPTARIVGYTSAAAAPSPSRSAAPPPARWCTSPRPPADARAPGDDRPAGDAPRGHGLRGHAVSLPGLDPASRRSAPSRSTAPASTLYVGTAAAARRPTSARTASGATCAGAQGEPDVHAGGQRLRRLSARSAALAVRPDGALLVADDPAIVNPGEPLGIGA